MYPHTPTTRFVDVTCIPVQALPPTHTHSVTQTLPPTQPPPLPLDSAHRHYSKQPKQHETAMASDAAKTGSAAASADDGKVTEVRPGVHSVMVSGTRFDVDKKYKIIKPIGHGAYGVVV